MLYLLTGTRAPAQSRSYECDAVRVGEGAADALTEELGGRIPTALHHECAHSVVMRGTSSAGWEHRLGKWAEAVGCRWNPR
jgi:hypothetical protein